MPCFHPIPAWQFPNIKTENGKSVISLKDPYAPESPERIALSLPCGKCVGCRTARARSWAVRCVHESSLYDNNCFITLTYHDFFIPDNGSLVKEDFVNFMKRLRKRIAPLNMACCYRSDAGRLKVDKFYTSFGVRFFHCGEYGSKTERPHHHACLFNFDFPDRELWKEKDGIRLYRSKMLEELWTDPKTGEQFGFATVGDVTPDSAAYVARYVLKKINGDRADDHYGDKLPEYITMSRKPGIGAAWMDKFADDIYPEDELLFGTMKLKPPRFYDKLFEAGCKEKYGEIVKKRLDMAKGNPNNSDTRLRVREKIALAKYKTQRRSLEENES